MEVEGGLRCWVVFDAGGRQVCGGTVGTRGGRAFKGHAEGMSLDQVGAWQSWQEVAMGERGGCPIGFRCLPSTPPRAILVRRDEVRPLSSEFTPETERQRIQQLVGALGRGRLWSPGSWV